MWGIALLAETSTRAAIAVLLPTRVFLALGPVTGWVLADTLDEHGDDALGGDVFGTR